MVRNLIRNQAPGNRLRVRIPCPPLEIPANCRTKPLLACLFLGLFHEYACRLRGFAESFLYLRETILGTRASDLYHGRSLWQRPHL